MVTDLSVVIVSWNVRSLLQRCLSSIVQSPGLNVQAADGHLPCPHPRPEVLGQGVLTGVAAGRGGPWLDEGGAQPPPLAVRPLETVTRHWETDLIVVDNASSDGSAGMVREEFPQATLIPNPANRGFTAAINQGIAASDSRYVLLLNPDTEVIGDAVGTMLAYMESNPDVGLLGPQLLYPDGSIQPSRRRFPTLATALVESTIIQGFFTKSRTLRRYYMADSSDSAVQEVDWVVGAAMLVRREVIRQVGGLDEGFFMYSEEMDWCKRIKGHAPDGPPALGPVTPGAANRVPAGNWRIVYLPTAQVVHHEGKSSEQALAIRHIHFHASKVRYLRKHHGWWQGQVVRLFILTTYVWQLAEESLKWLAGHKRGLRRERVRVYWQVIRSGLTVSA
jgi:hypothetical protein